MIDSSSDGIFCSVFGDIPLSRLLGGAFAIMLLITVAFTGYLIVNSSRKIVDSVVVKLAHNIAHDVNTEVARFLGIPDVININTQQAIQAGRVDIENKDSLARFLWDAAHRNLENLVSSIYFASSGGSFISIGVADSHHPEDDQVFSVSAPYTNGVYTDFKPGPNGTLGEILELHGNYDPRVRPWFKKAMANPKTAVWSDIYSDFDTGEATLTRAITVQGDNQTTIGVAAVDLFIEHLQEFLDTLILSGNTEVFITSDEGLLIAAVAPAVNTDEQTHNIPAEQSPFPYTRAATRYIQSNKVDNPDVHAHRDILVTLEGVNGLLSVAPIGQAYGVDWQLGIFLPKNDFLGSIWDQAKLLVPLVLMVLLVAIGSIMAFLSLVTRPLRQLTTDANLIAAGDFSVPIQSAGNNEVGDLAKSLDNMQRKLATSFKDLLLRDRAIAEVDVGIVICDALESDLPILYVNRALESMTGYTSEQLMGKNPRLFQGSDRDQSAIVELRTAITNNKPVQVTLRNHRKDGSEYLCEVAIFPVTDGSGETTHYIGVQTDITERVNTETQLRRAQKTQAIGQLSGGIAHDFNNLLSIISGQLEFLQASNLDDSVQHHISKAEHAADMGARLTHRLLAFARQGYLEPTVVDLNVQVENSLAILKPTIGESIEIVAQLDNRLWPVRIDPSEIENAVVNLTINARDAMPEGGVIRVETGNVSLDTQAANTLLLPSGDYIRLTIADTGTGMSEKTQARIFEPFYTTKAPDKGTGLGLASVYGFVQQSGGNIIVNSVLAQGTSLQMYLPRHAQSPGDKPSPDSTQQATARKIPQASNGGKNRILVVEDNPWVLEVTVTRLNSLGYSVIQAESGPAALKILQGDKKINLLFCDLVLGGGMSGQEVAHWVHINYPECKILLTSGFSDQQLVETNPGIPHWRVLQKPYKLITLKEAVADLLRLKEPGC